MAVAELCLIGFLVLNREITFKQNATNSGHHLAVL